MLELALILFVIIWVVGWAFAAFSMKNAVEFDEDLALMDKEEDEEKAA